MKTTLEIYMLDDHVVVDVHDRDPGYHCPVLSLRVHPAAPDVVQLTRYISDRLPDVAKGFDTAWQHALEAIVVAIRMVRQGDRPPTTIQWVDGDATPAEMGEGKDHTPSLTPAQREEAAQAIRDVWAGREDETKTVMGAPIAVTKGGDA